MQNTNIYTNLNNDNHVKIYTGKYLENLSIQFKLRTQTQLQVHFFKNITKKQIINNNKEKIQEHEDNIKFLFIQK